MGLEKSATVVAGTATMPETLNVLRMVERVESQEKEGVKQDKREERTADGKEAETTEANQKQKEESKERKGKAKAGAKVRHKDAGSAPGRNTLWTAQGKKQGKPEPTFSRR